VTDSNREPLVGVSGRVIALLRLFAECGETLSIQEISERLDLAPSSVHRLLAGLVDENIVERAAGRRYRVGREFARIGALASRKISAPRLARPLLHRLTTATGEASMLLLLLPRARELTVVDRIESVHSLRYRVLVNSRRPLLSGAAGRVVLAWLEVDEVRKIHAASSIAPFTGDPPWPLTALDRALSEIRELGFSVTRGDVALGAVDIAAPVFDADNRAIGALAITIPEMRFRRKDQPKLTQLIMACAQELSAAMGAPAERPRISPLTRLG
jgi:DNA-binding IclR family transcriptional regulator